MILAANWDFGMAELLQVITAIATILAVLVSLYLANRARRIKKKVLVSDDGIIRIVNVGDSKFTISALGYVIGDILFINNKQKYIKPLSESRQLFNNNITAHWDSYFSNVVLEPGDCVETEIFVNKNDDPTKIKSVFYVINYKIYYQKHKFKKLMISENGSIRSCKKNNMFDCFK